MKIEELKSKAESGDKVAQYELGEKYFKIDDGIQDFNIAVYWLEKSAAQGYAPAQWRLGICYAQGWGVKPNSSKMLELYLKSAKQGFAEAQHFLGLAYANGHGFAVPRDIAESYKWFKKAAEQGHKEAQQMVKFYQTVFRA